MNNTFGNSLKVTLFGESHGSHVGVIVDGLTPGMTVDLSAMQARLASRRPGFSGTTARVEADGVTVISGVKNGVTTGAPVALLLTNTKQVGDQTDYAQFPRPSHGDYPAFRRFGGSADLSGGGHFSARLTAPLVAAGSILLDGLNKKGITVTSQIASIGTVCDADLLKNDRVIPLNGTHLPVSCGETEDRMMQVIDSCMQNGDTVGGCVRTAVLGLPVGVGEPWFDSLESVLAHGLFSIPAVKGVFFGDQHLSQMTGSIANDAYALRDGEVYPVSHHGGGVAGGLSVGGPVLFTTEFKPIPTLDIPQKTVDLMNMTEVTHTTRSRHDVCAVLRAWPVVDAVTALVLSDLLLNRYGWQYFEV